MNKNLITLSALFLVCLSLQAQEVKNYGPKAGNFGIGISADPALKYIGNFFGKTTNNEAPTVDIPNDYSIFGKYYTDNKNAYRVGLNFGCSLNSMNISIDPQIKKEHSSFGISLAVGKEKRIGSGRIQGFFGPSAGLGFSTNNDHFIYETEASNDDITNKKYGNTFNFALGGFAGVEYFLTENMAIGTELGFGLNYSYTGKETTKYLSETTQKSPATYSLSLGFNQTPAQMAYKGSIYMSLYF